MSDALCSWLAVDLGHPIERHLLTSMPLEEMLRRLAPIQGTWTKRLVVATKSRWTACFDNSHLGGDQVSWLGYLHRRLACEAIIATHIPTEQYELPATQFQLLGPQGSEPLGYVRTISAGIFDEGHWRFLTSGTPQSFEDTDAYRARRIRDRLTREIIVRYLLALGIRADAADFYGHGVLVQELKPWSRSGVSIEEWRRLHGRPPTRASDGLA